MNGIIVHYELRRPDEPEMLGFAGYWHWRIKIGKATIGYISYVVREQGENYYTFQRNRDITDFMRKYRFDYQHITDDLWNAINELNFVENESITEIKRIIENRLYTAAGMHHFVEYREGGHGQAEA